MARPVYALWVRPEELLKPTETNPGTGDFVIRIGAATPEKAKEECNAFLNGILKKVKVKSAALVVVLEDMTEETVKKQKQLELEVKQAEVAKLQKELADTSK